MKTITPRFLRFLFAFVLLSFASCQEEFEDTNEGGEEQETIEASSTTANLILNTSSQDGSFDNIVDEASCFAIQFPYAVEVAGIQITIDSIEDLRVIEELFDQIDTDEDIVHIIFPITIIYADFTELVIENVEQLRELAADCIEGGGDDDIECIDFVYPITIFTFDVNAQIAGEVVINNDKELRRFFANLDESDLVSLDYPLTLKKYDGTELVVENNAELARALEAAKNECDEDDDDDYNDDDFDEEHFVEYLTECPWKLRDIRRFGTDQLGQYEGFTFEFNTEGGVDATGPSGNTFSGEWAYEFTDNGLVVELAFTDNTDFSATWTVYEIGEGKIKFFSDNDNRIILKKRCADNDCTAIACTEVFVTISVKVVDATGAPVALDSYKVIDKETGEDVTPEHNIMDAQLSGEYTIATDAMLDQNQTREFEFMGYLGDKQVVSGEYKIEKDCCHIELVRGHLELVLDDETNPDTLREILKECAWVIKKVALQGEDIDRLLGFEFQFLAEGVATLSNGETVSEGTWEIGLDDNQVPSLLIEFGDEPAVNFEWPLRDLTNDRLKFGIEEIDYELVLQRVCNDSAGDQDVLEIRNIMMGGAWNVARLETVLNSGDTAIGTEEFTGYDFYFNQMHRVNVDENDNPITEGLWRVVRNYRDELVLYLNTGDEAPFDDLTQAWYITDVSSDRIELVYEDENIPSKILVFEKSL